MWSITFHIEVTCPPGGSFAEFQHDDSSIELDCADNQQFSIWVSFAEIYNEFIYDLLSEPPAKGKQRTALKIAEDRNHNHFIKGRSCGAKTRVHNTLGHT